MYKRQEDIIGEGLDIHHMYKTREERRAKVLNKEQDKASILGQLRKFTEQIRTCLLYTSIRLNELVPDLMKLMDEKKLGFTTAVELSLSLIHILIAK